MEALSTTTRILPASVELIVRSDRGDVRLTVGRHGEVDGVASSRMGLIEATDFLAEDIGMVEYRATGPGDGSLFLTERARAMHAPLLAALDATSWETWA